jgi:ferritin-like metal-binding protein YciE
VFKEMGGVPELFPSQAITGLLDDSKWMMVRLKGDPALDLALIDGAQKAENYEISCYQSALALASYLNMEKVISTCEIILEEEKDAKRKLRHIRARLLGLAPDGRQHQEVEGREEEPAEKDRSREK